MPGYLNAGVRGKQVRKKRCVIKKTLFLNYFALRWSSVLQPAKAVPNDAAHIAIPAFARQATASTTHSKRHAVLQTF